MRDESDLIRFEIIGVVRIALCLRGGQSPCHAGGLHGIIIRKKACAKFVPIGSVKC